MGQIVGKQVLGSICGVRGFPPDFAAPNTENVIYSYDCRDPTGSAPPGLSGTNEPSSSKDNAIGKVGEGILLSDSGASPSKCRTLKKYGPTATDAKVVLSGRLFVQAEAGPLKNPDEVISPSGRPQAGCIFKVCTRGTPVVERVLTRNFAHELATVTSGVYFALYIEHAWDNACYLNPRLMLTLESGPGDEILLVEDRMGPLPLPMRFFIDFAIVDDGGRNLQMDLIFRVPPPRPLNADDTSELDLGVDDKPPPGMKTLRTCLQDYTTFNSQVVDPVVVIAPLDTSVLPQGTTVWLQNLVMSKENKPAIEQKPTVGPLKPISPLGADASSTKGQSKVDEPDPEQAPAQRSPSSKSWREAGRLMYEGSYLKQVQGRSAQANASALEVSKANDFWYHIRYDGSESPRLTRSHRGLADDWVPPLSGEFWLTKEVVDTSNVYFQCSSSLAQAMTMCIIFRFSCPPDYLPLMESEACTVLQNVHIPTNGVVLGVEPDPRNPRLIRMFIEHRNEIVDDIVICECSIDKLARTKVHQEVYDSGESISYKVTVTFLGGSQQQVALKLPVDRIEADDRISEDPSARWPICACASRHILSPANRIFVYSSVASPKVLESEEVAEECYSVATFQTAGRETSEAALEDWQSAGGGMSDHEGQELAVGLNKEGAACVEWPRPVIDSMLLMSNVEVAPFSVPSINFA
mmetsp:Transcript_78999/g.164089  ORF Transcript_78999/g.164089 Transcript_78999/m.164089 type:complete len:693 (-) Transcript_78999:96-2174(-)|eukprot:CAMPEP_0206447860 /NCGR_PEP_ID=MMETSP0324_2-20121206/17091_1 /ASSEMBLY_ACC=CAM_ASM_000836 /TAXON_ID=2866 /ORGANISM="Crypthecodinium cohnii, Strain Seligo" /LENGTH=692 /DNA_ID=CAMNT_0053916819 /DNA_START=88 /DNA_END=2166 /DNA_ORIENTATION=-